MYSFLKLAWGTVKVFVLFTGSTLLFYYGIVWINEEYENYHRYDEPQGGAVKVASLYDEKEPNVLERLLFFYQYGE
jgi:hypothetical protein